MCLLRDLPGLRAHLAYLVAGGRILPWRLRDFRRLRVARPDRISRSGRGGRPHRSGKPRRPPRGARSAWGRPMSIVQDVASGDDLIGVGRRSYASLPRFEHAQRMVASKRVITAYGFWIFLLSDIIMFSAFFAAYAVLSGEIAGGPSGKDVFSLTRVALETAALLLSSFACGIASIGARARNGAMYYGGMTATVLLGAAFLFLEISEFYGLIAQGAGPSRSAFLSSFFALVGCHGLHVTLGMLWLLTMMAQVFAKGYRADIMRRVLCFALFWHTLDIIWVGIFTVVYLMGVAV